MLIKTKAIVLKIRPMGEHDRMLVLLSKEFGRMEVLAKRVKSVRSKLSAGTQPLCYTEFCIFRGKSYDIVNTADLIESFYDLRLDVTALSLASYFCDLTNFVSPHEESSWDCLRLLLNTLHYLEKGEHPPALLKAIFELRLLSLSGLMPDLTGCVQCGREAGSPMQLDPARGVLVCEQCAPGARGTLSLGEGTLRAMRQIMHAPERKLFSFLLGEDSRRQLAQVSERYVIVQIDHHFSSLALYRQFAGIQGPNRKG